MNKNTLILVVEDEDDIAEILMSYLGKVRISRSFLPKLTR